MNMMMNNDGTVDFHATLFALVRTSLSIKKPDGKRSYLYFVTSWCYLLKGEYVLRSQRQLFRETLAAV